MKLELDNTTIWSVNFLTSELATRAILNSSENICFGRWIWHKKVTHFGVNPGIQMEDYPILFIRKIDDF